MRKVLLLLLLSGLQGCELLQPKACTDIAIPGIAVTLRDSISGASVVAEEITAIATDEMYADTASPSFTGGPVLLARERAGTYRVEAKATGYMTWVQNGVRVTADDCHVRTVELVARLQPGS